jgi:hypothetical protein
MSEKQKEALERFGAVIEKMSDKELENLLLVGEGMAIMSGIKENRQSETEPKRA